VEIPQTLEMLGDRTEAFRGAETRQLVRADLDARQGPLLQLVVADPDV
jgi:hypothetical protein